MSGPGPRSPRAVAWRTSPRHHLGVGCLLAALAAAPLHAQQPSTVADDKALAAVLTTAERATDDRLQALVALQDRGALSPELAAAAMGAADDDVARAAAAIVRHEWRELPPGLFAALDRSPAAARAFLGELAIAPRPAAMAWVATRCGPDLPRDDRLLAFAARGEVRGEAAELLLQALCDDDFGNGVRAALAVLPPSSADRLLGKVHVGLMEGRIRIERVPLLLDRLSPAGVRRVMALIVSLPDEQAMALCDHLQLQAPQLLAERVAAALDDPTPIATCWLPHAGPHLAVPARRERLLALLTDAQQPAARRDHAFTALLATRIVDQAMLDFAVDPDVVRGERLVRGRRLLDAAVETIPAATLWTWLDCDEQLALRTAQALGRRRQLEPELAERLARDLRTAGSADGQYLAAAAMAVVHRGDEASVRAAWPALRTSMRFDDVVDGLAKRPDAFVPVLLREELAALTAAATAAATAPATAAAGGDVVADGAAARFERQRAMVELALAARGDGSSLQALVARAGSLESGMVRRCAHHVPVLPAAAALQLLDLAGITAAADGVAAGVGASERDDDVRVELVAWAAGAVADERVAARLTAIWNTPPREPLVEELHEVALRALVAGGRRQQLVAELRAALVAAPLPSRFVPLPYEVLASMPTPLGADDLRLCAELVLWPGCTDAEREAEAAVRFPDGTGGFPLVTAVAQRLRGADAAAVDAAFATVVDTVQADARAASIAPQRLLVFWRTLTIEPSLLQVLGPRLAPLLRSDERALRAPADLFRARDAVARGEPAAAASAARAAIAGLLRLPSQRAHARVFLGERDPGAGVDPWAALSALPHLAAAHAAVAARDAAALRAALHLVREFAGHDAGTLATLDTFPTPETLR